MNTVTHKYISWIILILVFVATGLNFLDRQVLSITIIKIQREFNFSDVQYGVVNTSFLISYALMFTVGGALTERFGGKIGLGFSVLIWSVASLLHGVMTGFTQLIIFRFLLGIGEGGCFPAAAKTVSELFDPKEKAMANGIAIGGSAMGAVLAPPLTIYISNQLNWRWSFIIPGIIGVIWFIIWVAIPWSKARKNNPVLLSTSLGSVSILKVLTNKFALVFILIRFLLDPVFYFIMFWIPKYLNAERSVSFDDIGRLLWIPFLALGLSNIFGGWISDRLTRTGVSVNAARKIVMGIAALLTTSAILVQGVSTVAMAIALMSVLMFAHGFWITNYITSISDVFADKGTSMVIGLSGTAGAVAGLIFNPLIGMVIQNYSYQPLWIVCGLMYPIAFILLLVFIPRIQSVKL